MARQMTPAQADALDRDGDGAPGGSLPAGQELVTVTEKGDRQVSDGEGGMHPAGAEIVVSDAQAETLRASGYVR